MTEEATTTETEETEGQTLEGDAVHQEADEEADDGITVLDERCSHMTEVKLSAEESLEALLDKLEEYDDVKDAAKDSASSYRAKLKTIEDELKGLRENGTTTRAFECKKVRDDRRGVLYFERLDTGEKLDERPLSAAERQAELPLDSEPSESGEVETSPCCGTCEHWEPGDVETNDGECRVDEPDGDEGWPITHYAEHCDGWTEPKLPEKCCATCAHWCADDDQANGDCAEAMTSEDRTKAVDTCDAWVSFVEGEPNGTGETEGG